MKTFAVVLLICALWEVKGYPYYPYYGSIDTLSYGLNDNRQSGMVLNRYYNPYLTPQVGGGMAAFMVKQPELPEDQPSQYYFPDRRRQTPQEQIYPQQPNYLQTPQEPKFPPQQENEVFYPVVPEKPTQVPIEATEIAYTTGKPEVLSTTVKVVPELLEPEVEVVEEKPRKVSKKKQGKRPVLDEENDEETPRWPGGMFFPMFFGWGKNSEGAPGGATAIANAYSTGRGVASSHATSYGMPTPDFRNYKNYKNYQQQE